MDVSSKEVKDAAEALAAVLKGVTLSGDSHNNHELRGSMDTIVESIENLIVVATEISATSNQNFDEKMETVSQHLASIKDGMNLSNENKSQPFHDN